ncbi:hypothetical protein [Kitasatospora kifunensis]|uniref:Uncharacterized protein n=1 Tax=Kitasatospora kifunensis TaxID=58351 RepID=A0A7W7W0V4_KITKI|nr:hypothetical protein [Kitasatospora kifunensis]MBB4929040.1 hypothetical protein [Kitasatospora kifunensis]
MSNVPTTLLYSIGVPETTNETDGGETAEAVVTRALAEWGITAHDDEESMIGGDRNSWLVVAHDQGNPAFPSMLDGDPYVVVFLYSEDEDEITVDRAPRPGDVWHVAVGDGTGRECTLPPRPAEQLGACIEDIAEWVTAPRTSLEALVDLQDLRGRFEDGYTPENIRSTFGRIQEAGGPLLVCVWDYADEDGFGGNSQFYSEDENGTLFEVQLEIHQWLSGKRGMPAPLETWTCAPIAEPIESAITDGFHNHARADLTG